MKMILQTKAVTSAKFDQAVSPEKLVNNFSLYL